LNSWAILQSKNKSLIDQGIRIVGKKIKRPDANPVLALLLTWFVLGLGHVIVNGQTNKWLMIFLVVVCVCQES